MRGEAELNALVFGKYVLQTERYYFSYIFYLFIYLLSLAQIVAVLPISAYLILFLLVLLREPLSQPGTVFFGLCMAVLGLMLFLEGLKAGLMPLGNTMGSTLPRKASLPLVCVVAFVLGVGVTFAEPSIGSLQLMGSLVDGEREPLLWALLNDASWSTALMFAVGGGVGIAAVLGVLMFLYRWPIKRVILGSLLPTIVMSALAPALDIKDEVGVGRSNPVNISVSVLQNFIRA